MHPSLKSSASEIRDKVTQLSKLHILIMNNIESATTYNT